MNRTLQDTLAESDTTFHRRDHRAQAVRTLGRCRQYALAPENPRALPDPPEPLARSAKEWCTWAGTWRRGEDARSHLFMPFVIALRQEAPRFTKERVQIRQVLARIGADIIRVPRFTAARGPPSAISACALAALSMQ
jgi:hypothetical protein